MCSDFWCNQLELAPGKYSTCWGLWCPPLGLLSHLPTSYYRDFHAHSSLQSTNILTRMISSHAHRLSEKGIITIVVPFYSSRCWGSFNWSYRENTMCPPSGATTGNNTQFLPSESPIENTNHKQEVATQPWTVRARRRPNVQEWKSFLQEVVPDFHRTRLEA